MTKTTKPGRRYLHTESELRLTMYKELSKLNRKNNTTEKQTNTSTEIKEICPFVLGTTSVKGALHRLVKITRTHLNKAKQNKALIRQLLGPKQVLRPPTTWSTAPIGK